MAFWGLRTLLCVPVRIPSSSMVCLRFKHDRDGEDSERAGRRQQLYGEGASAAMKLSCRFPCTARAFFIHSTASLFVFLPSCKICPARGVPLDLRDVISCHWFSSVQIILLQFFCLQVFYSAYSSFEREAIPLSWAKGVTSAIHLFNF